MKNDDMNISHMETQEYIISYFINPLPNMKKT